MSGIVSTVSTIIEFRGTFRLVEEGHNRLRKMGRGTWYCRCGEQAVTGHEKPRCEECKAGGDCGRDCSLTSLYCPSCGASLSNP
jgi:hypothetical protein